MKKVERKHQKEKGENWEAEMIDIHEKEGEIQRESGEKERRRWDMK